MLRFPRLTNFKILRRKFVISIIIVLKLLCGMLSFDFNKKNYELCLLITQIRYYTFINACGIEQTTRLIGISHINMKCNRCNELTPNRHLLNQSKQ